MTDPRTDHMKALFHQMRDLLQEILAADTRITAVSFQVVYLSADQVERIRRAIQAGKPFSAPSAPPPA